MLLAHQGGWDEFLLVAAPLAVFVLLLRVAGRRATRIAAERAARETAATTAAPTPLHPDER